jgi:hypothetical protein
MPRPDTIRISVAMIGWIPSAATRKPFHMPHNMPAASAENRIVTCGSPILMRQTITAPTMAMMEPTERSMPRVPITTAMPSATRAVGTAR